MISLVHVFYNLKLLFTSVIQLETVSTLVKYSSLEHNTRNTHSQRTSPQYYDAHEHKRITQLCTRMSITDILDRDGHVHTYIVRIDPSFRASR